MRPILMKGHERPLTFLRYNKDGDLRYNKDGDLLFSCAKDHQPTLWFADGGERLGTFVGHNGAVWSCDVSKIGESVIQITGPSGRINSAVWGPLNKTILSADEDATIRIWDSKRQLLKESDREKGHQKAVTSISKSADGSYILTDSLDKSAKIWDTRTLTLIKTYVTESPVNACTMSPLLNHVMIGGGLDASLITQTRAGKFESKFFHKILEDGVGAVKGHFGPINALAFNPDGRSFSTGREDGYIRLHHLDEDYYNNMD